LIAENNLSSKTKRHLLNHLYFHPKPDLMSEIILEINALHKKYRDVTALESLSFQVKRGQIFGLLGPNGSGKTTTLGILLGSLNATSGTFSWFGNGQQDENRRNIGALLETPNFYPYLNAQDNLVVVAKIKGMTGYESRIEQVLKDVNLWDRRLSKFRTFSLGMKQRLAIASALLNNPDVLVLDEPTNGLDPQGIAEMRNLILDIAKTGKTIIIASHILDEIEKICTHVAIMRFGKLLQYGEIGDIMSHEKRFIVRSGDLSQLENSLTGIQGVLSVKPSGKELLIAVEDGFDPAQLNRLLTEKGIYLSELREHRQNLETTFLEIVEA
jgi:ABC-type multidrug transport system ATPase subunit